MKQDQIITRLLETGSMSQMDIGPEGPWPKELFIPTKISMKRKESHVRCHLLCLYHGLLRVKGDKEHESSQKTSEYLRCN